MQIEEMESLPPDSWPFSHDHYHMGTTLGSNVLVLHENHADKPAQYLIICHLPTGKRIRVLFPEFAERTAMHPDVMTMLMS